MQRAPLSEKQTARDLDHIVLHDHLALFYSSTDELTVVTAIFLRQGLELGQRCVFIGSDETVALVLAAMRERQVDVDREISRGALLTRQSLDLVGENEPFDPNRFIGCLEHAVSDTLAAGFNGLRTCDQKTWIFRSSFAVQLLTEYESRMNDMVRQYDLAAMCLYDLREFSPDIVREVIRTHPKVVLKGRLCRNFSYLPPEEIFTPQSAALEVRNVLSEILQHRDLEMQKAIFENVFNVLPDWIFLKDLQGRYLLINPAGAAFLGKPVEQIIGHTIDEILERPEEAAPLVEADQLAFASKAPVTAEFAITGSGVTRTFSAIKGAFHNGNGEIRGVFGISRDVTEQRMLEKELADYQEQLRKLASEIAAVEGRERREIASALHDQIGQTLALAKITLDGLQSKLQHLACAKEYRGDLVRVGELIDEVIQHSRSLTEEVSPPILYTVGLEAAVESLTEKFQARYDLAISFQDDQAVKPLDDDLRGLLFQSIRELLVNIVKHAHATSASVSLSREGDYLRVVVTDNGRGFDGSPKKIRAGSDVGFGLFRLREGLKAAGGCLDLQSAPGKGTTVVLLAPLVDAPAPDGDLQHPA